MSVLTRDQMVQTLREGKSVLHGEGMHRRIISREEDLPSEAELATGDREELLKAREIYVARRGKLDAEIASIDAELAALGGPRRVRQSKAGQLAEQEALGGPQTADGEPQTADGTSQTSEDEPPTPDGRPGKPEKKPAV